MIPVLTIRKSLKSWKGVSLLIWKDLTGSLVTSPVFWQRSSQNYTKRIRKRYHGIPLDFSQILLAIPRFSSSLSYMVSFVFLFSSFVSLAFFCLCVFLNQKIYVLIHILLCGQVSEKNFSLGRFPETRLLSS